MCIKSVIMIKILTLKQGIKMLNWNCFILVFKSPVSSYQQFSFAILYIAFVGIRFFCAWRKQSNTFQFIMSILKEKKVECKLFVFIIFLYVGSSNLYCLLYCFCANDDMDYALAYIIFISLSHFNWWMYLFPLTRWPRQQQQQQNNNQHIPIFYLYRNEPLFGIGEFSFNEMA